MDEENKTKDIVECLDIEVQRLRVWVKEGYIVPSKPSTGQGKSSLYTKQDIYAIALFKELIEGGFKRELAGKYVKHIQDKKAWLIIKNIPFLAFPKIINEKGKAIIDMMAHGYTPLILKIEAGNITPMMITDDGHCEETTDKEQIVWKSLYIVNFAQIRADVDKAFD